MKPQQTQLQQLLAQLAQHHYEFYVGDLNIRTHVTTADGQCQQIGVPLQVRDTNCQHQFDGMLAYRDHQSGHDQLYTVALVFNDERVAWIDVDQPEFATAKTLFIKLLALLHRLPQQP